MTDDPNEAHRDEAERCLTEDWTMAGFRLAVQAMEAHPQRDLIKSLQMETDELGECRWSPCRLVEEDVDDPWVEMWLLPWPTDRPEDRPPIKIGTWPLSLEADALANAESSGGDEQDDTPRWH